LPSSERRHTAISARSEPTWRAVAAAAVGLYGDDPAVPFAAIAAELATEVRLLRAVLAERARHAEARERAYRAVDVDQLARTLPGVADIGKPVLVSAMGDPARFRDAAAFKRFTGITPRTSATGDTDRKGQPITKAGPRRLRDQLVQSANTARRLDPQLAAVYYTQIVERGAHHHKALCVVAARLAERAWTVLNRQRPYELRDIDGTPITAAEARAIVEDRYRISDDVRRRRRARAGKAPHQVLEAHTQSHTRTRVDNRGDLPRDPSQPRPLPRRNPATHPAVTTRGLRSAHP
jgi:hypothetical protein